MTKITTTPHGVIVERRHIPNLIVREHSAPRRDGTLKLRFS